MESSDSVNEAENDMQVLLEKQDSQFRAATEALKDSLNNLGSALDNSISKLSKSFDKKIDKLISAQTSGQPEDLNRERQETGTSASSFQAGNVKIFLENWKKITSDKYILDIAKHEL